MARRKQTCTSMSRMNQANQRQRLGKLNPQVDQPTQSLVETVIFLVVVQALSFIESASTLEVLLMKDRLLKVVTWRIISILVTLLVLSLFTGDVRAATGITIFLHALLTVIHLVFETLWKGESNENRRPS